MAHVLSTAGMKPPASYEWRVTRPEPFLERRYLSQIVSTYRNPQAVCRPMAIPYGAVILRRLRSHL